MKMIAGAPRVSSRWPHRRGSVADPLPALSRADGADGRAAEVRIPAPAGDLFRSELILTLPITQLPGPHHDRWRPDPRLARPADAPLAVPHPPARSPPGQARLPRAVEAHARHLGPPWVGPRGRGRAGQQVVRDGRGRPGHQGARPAHTLLPPCVRRTLTRAWWGADLGPCVGRAQAVAHGPHLDRPRPRRLVAASLPLLVRGGQGAPLMHAYSREAELTLTMMEHRWSSAGTWRLTKSSGITTATSRASTPSRASRRSFS